MLAYERNHGFYQGAIIAGIDEVGRGPLYGEVVAAAVILSQDFDIAGINDSKKLSVKKRNIWFDLIIEQCEVGIGMATPQEIDDINILQATKLAMKRAVEGLSTSPDILLIDAVKLSDIPIEQVSIIKGDQLSASIAAASIIAKVTRDRMMVEEAAKHPQYALERHKGYGTTLHYEALDRYGLLPKHRRSFLKKYENNSK